MPDVRRSLFVALCLQPLMLHGCATVQPAPDFTRSTQIVCRTERPMGSHVPQRVCFTAEESKAFEKASREAMRRATSRGNACEAPTCD